MERREFIVTAGAVIAAASNGSLFGQQKESKPSYRLAPLPYAFDALEPYIDARTMELHHDKHHAAYVDKLNKALEDHADLQGKPLEQLLSNIDSLPADLRGTVRNQGGGHFNHSLFWTIMKKGGGGEPRGDLASAINSSFGSFGDFKSKFSTAAGNVFGSGWVWVSISDGKLMLSSAVNQDNPLMTKDGGKPIFCLDVWEHAYYLKYQNRRPDYIDAWWNVINWDQIADNYSAAKK